MYKNYEAWNVSEFDFPKSGSIEEKISFISRYGLLAANIHNTQPWLISIENNILKLQPDWDKQLKAADPEGKNLYISLGCFVKNIEIAASHFSYTTQVDVIDDLIQIRFIKSSRKEDSKLFPYLKKRYTNRLPFSSKPISQKYISEFSKLTYGNFSLKFSNNKIKISEAALLYQTAISEEANKGLDKELVKWLKVADTNDFDGMPLFTQGMSVPLSKVMKRFVMKYAPRKVATKMVSSVDSKKIKNSPLIAVIDGVAKNKVDWMNIGRLYQEFTLQCFVYGFFASPMHSLVESHTTSKKLNLVFDQRLEPQTFFRIGYASNDSYHTPRKPLSWCVDTEQELINSLGIQIEKNFIKVGQYNIRYIKTGKGTPLVLVHGGNIGWGQWYPNLKELSKHFTVYAIDMPGGGRSSRVDFSTFDLNDYPKVLNQFIEELDLKNLHIAGSSMGGWAAARVAIQNKEIDKLILADSVGFTNTKSFANRILENKFIAKLLCNTVFKASRDNIMLENLVRSTFFNPGMLVSRKFIEYFYETTLTSHNMMFISRMIRDLQSLYLGDDLEKINNQTLILWGDNDTSLPLSDSKSNFKLIKKSKVEVFKNAGHIISIEKSEGFNDSVLRFLKSK